MAAFIDAKKRDWLGGLSRGLIAAGLPPIGDAVLPFYGNAFAQRIREYEDQGGRRPELELGTAVDDEREKEERALLATKSAALDGLLRRLDFDPARELVYSEPALAAHAAERGVTTAEELGWEDFLRVPVLRAGLGFLARKTGIAAEVIEEFLTDVAYYLELPAMRDGVLEIVEADLERAAPDGGPVVVVGHSLGSVVAYDLLAGLDSRWQVRLFVTAGSPLGLPVVAANLRGKVPGHPPEVPAAVPVQPGSWVNAYDVRDVVALIHPLAPVFAPAVALQVDDQRTRNATDPHSIADYLSDPDIAGPIGRVLRQ
ncbi:hypothetical protein [Actinomycetospora atypica]|uniref:Uncharacterized protein n=1 Tax=Actinomycetospora atypica TaxID=1290095 RepID=A0ABV9YJU6_9PSEU